MELEQANERREAAAVERRRQAAQRGAQTRKTDAGLKGLFDDAQVPHDWLGVDQPVNEEGAGGVASEEAEGA